MPAKTYKTTLLKDGSMCAIPVPFDPRPIFGKIRAPVRVTLNGYSFRSTIAAMGGPLCIPLRKSNREAAGVNGDETLKVTVELDTETRDVTPPADLTKARSRSPPRLDPASRHSSRYSDEMWQAVESPENQTSDPEHGCWIETSEHVLHPVAKAM